MRIERLDLFSYGHLREQSLDLSSPPTGLTVVVGANEAGKSTTMRALTSLLFGIERNTTDDYGQGRESLRVGALLVDDGTRLEVVRQGLARVPLVSPEGQIVDEGAISTMLGNIERALFRVLFCIDHDELHERSEGLLDADGEIGRLVFGASLGATALSRVLHDLEGQARALFKPQGSAQHVATSLNKARQLAKDARLARVRSRDWERDEGDLLRLEQAVEGMRGDLGSLRSEEAALEHLRSALPLLARREQLLGGLADLEAVGAVQPLSWADAVDETSGSLRQSREKHEKARRARDVVVDKLQNVELSEPLLAAGELIDEVLESVGRYRKDRVDLPQLQGQLRERGATIATLLERLGMDDVMARAISDPQLLAIEHLAEEWTSLDSRMTVAQNELDAAEAEIEEQQHVLAGLPESPDVTALRRVLEVARSYQTREGVLAGERVALESLAGDVRAIARRLGLPENDFNALEGLVVPAQSAVRSHAAALSSLEQARARLTEDRDSLTNQIGEAQQARDAILADPSVPDPAALDNARVRRNEGWELVRAAWLDGSVEEDALRSWTEGVELADAYTLAVTIADERADERFDNATRLAELAQAESRLEQLSGEQDALDKRDTELRLAGDKLDEEWDRLWDPVGVKVGDCAQAETWLDEFKALCGAIAEHRRRADAATAEESELLGQRQSLVKAMRAVGSQSEGKTLVALIGQASEVVAEAEQAAQSRHTAEQDLKRAESAKRKRTSELAKEKKRLTSWGSKWTAAVAAVAADGDIGPAAAREMTVLLREVRGQREQADSLQSRVEGLRGDIDVYVSRVRGVVEEVAPDLAEDEPSQALGTLKSRLAAARKALQRRDDLGAELAEAESRLTAAGLEIADTEDKLQRLLEAGGIAPEFDYEGEVERAREYSQMHVQVVEIEATLVEQGGGRTLTELLEAAERYDGDTARVSSRLDEVIEQVGALDEAIGDTNRRIGGTRTSLARADGSGDAASLDQDAEIEFATLAEHVADYARVAVAHEVLLRVVAQYGQENQGPIVGCAERHFARLTDGAFSELIVDYAGDSQVLLAKRRNGELLRLNQLSDGTRDQLYLALRLAGIENHFSHGGKRLPLILDDILINFDDDRARAAMEVLAELGRQTQILLFTHHGHLRDVACDLPDAQSVCVTGLTARNQDSPITTAPSAVPPAETRGAGRQHGGPLEKAVLDVLAGSSQPLGRAAILEQAGIPEVAWQPVIQALLQRGAVVQEGAKRGAKYRLASS